MIKEISKLHNTYVYRTSKKITKEKESMNDRTT